jgi:hypothetical protein
VMVLGPSPRIAATMCLVTAFFDPLTSTSPLSGPAGSISQASDTCEGYPLGSPRRCLPRPSPEE